MSLRFSLTVLVLAALLGSCDKPQEGAAQQQQNLPAQNPAKPASLTGEIDRSFAGEPMPAAKLTLPDGQSLDLSSLKGQPVLINLWATWCAPCVVEMPMLDTLAGEMDGRLKVLTISQDMNGAEAVVPFFERNRFAHLEPWLDPQNDLGFALGGGNLPITVLYGADGREIFRVTGGYEWDGEEARAQIEEALNAAAR